MKKVIFLSMSMALILFACQKDPATPKNPSLAGTFQWLKSVGGFTGSDVILPPDGEVITLHFYKGNRYEQRKNGIVIFSGNYEQKNVISVFTNKPEEAILLSGNPGIAWLMQPVYITAGDPIITFRENCSDCYEHFYKEVNQ